MAPLEQLARLFESKGRHADAAEAYAAGVEAAEAADQQRADQLALLQTQGRTVEARQLARDVAEAHTVHAIRLLHLGDLWAMAGKLDAALEAYRKAIALTPDHAPTWELVGAVQTAKDEFAAARASYARARDLAPTSASPSIGLAELELKAGRIEEAKKALQAATHALTGDEPEMLLFRVAGLFGATGEHKKAAVVYEDLLASAQDDVALWVALAREQRALGEPEAAMVSCGRAQAVAAERDDVVLGECAE